MNKICLVSDKQAGGASYKGWRKYPTSYDLTRSTQATHGRVAHSRKALDTPFSDAHPNIVFPLTATAISSRFWRVHGEPRSNRANSTQHGSMNTHRETAVGTNHKLGEEQQTRDQYRTPEQNFIFLSRNARDCMGGAAAPPQTAVGGLYLPLSPATAVAGWGRGVSPPSPASHQCGVSGGVWTPTLTPVWCDRQAGGDRHV